MTNQLPVKKLLFEGTKFLEKNNIPESQSICEILLACLLKCKTTDLLIRQDEIPESRITEALKRGLKRAAANEPIQYIIGTWDFHEISLKVDKRALIPRPETEQLVEKILNNPISTRRGITIADIGTGSGAIILAIANARREINMNFIAIDTSEEALSLAYENAQRLNLKIRFIHGSSCKMLPPGSLDIIVSNPPYIASADVETLPKNIKSFEPRNALDGGLDGLDILRQITADSAMILKPGGMLYYEIGDDQGPSMQRIMEESGFANVKIQPDFSGKIRFACGSIN